MNARNVILNYRVERPGDSVSIRSERLPAFRGKITTLATLSRQVPLDTVASRIASELIADHPEKRFSASGLENPLNGTCLLIRFTHADTSFPLTSWPAIAPTLNGIFGLSDRLVRDSRGFDLLNVTPAGDPAEPLFLEALLTHSRRHYHHILLILGAEESAVLKTASMRLANLTFLFFRNKPTNLANLKVIQGDFAANHLDPTRIRPTLFLEAEESASELENEFLRLSQDPGEQTVNLPTLDTSTFRFLRDRRGYFEKHIRGLAREISGRRVGVVFSAGGAKGLAHIGVIQVLEENGIEVDVLAGCSMGAYIASIWASGHDGSTLERLARELQGRWNVWKLVDPVVPPRKGFLRGEAVLRRLKRSIGDSHFTDLLKPLRVVATNLDTLECEVFSWGDVAKSVHASSAIPGVCVPVRLGDEIYIDGGIADPLPVDILRQMGVERILAVNTIPTPAHLRRNREILREQMREEREKMGLGTCVNRQLNYFASGNILDNLLRSIDGAQMRVAEQSSRGAHLVLRPLAVDPHWHEFSNPDKYISLGRQAAEENLEEILNLVNEQEADHAPASSPESMAITD